MQNPSTIFQALWPSVPEAEEALTTARQYIRTTMSSITSAESAQLKRKQKDKQTSFYLKKTNCLTIFVSSQFLAW